ncbi:MAG: hypothetical protein J5379_09335 [Clostridiales bacterium]|nr:hypothetical protein [Clostridiales bacterium]
MSQLVSYTCPKCGGVLNVDKSQEIYDCPFCGNSFDFIFFHRKELFGEAELCMHRMEFTAATDKFKAILERNPQDFQALRGLVLCAGKVRSKNDLKSPESLQGANFNQMLVAIQDVKKRAKDEDVPYFTKLSEMLEMAKQFDQTDKDKKNLHNDTMRQYGNIVNIENMRESSKQTAWEVIKAICGIITYPLLGDNPTDEERETAKLMGVGIVAIAFVILIFWLAGKWGVMIFIGIGLAVYGVCKYIRYIDDKKKAPFREEMREIHCRDVEYQTQMTEISKKYEVEFQELQKLNPARKKTSEKEQTDGGE